MEKYIIATIKEWNIKQYYLSKPKKIKNWYIVTDPAKLTFNYVNSIKPKYIFFPHWSQKVEKKITSNFKCICFHETNIPYGRGGSPIQNLIIRNKKETVITAIRMVEKLDAGPIYLKYPLSLNGNAQQVYERAAKIIFNMIKVIIKDKIKPLNQKGRVVKFKRRTMKQNIIPKKIKTLRTLFNHIRMLDAHSYPSAFINYGNLRIEFTNAKINKKNLDANVNIKFISKKNDLKI
jgi:methionyl-tRNA formyltransferase